MLANILRSSHVARTPPVEARSRGRHSNVENAPRRRPITGEPATLSSHIPRAILRTPPVTRQSAASSARRPRPAGRSHYVAISRDGRKVVTRVRVMLHSNATRAPIANPPNSAQLGAASTTPPSYIRVRAVVWAYGRGQTRHTDARDHNTFCVVYDSRKM